MRHCPTKLAIGATLIALKGLACSDDPKYTVAMGFKVEGVIQNEAGEPIVGAEVSLEVSGEEDVFYFTQPVRTAVTRSSDVGQFGFNFLTHSSDVPFRVVVTKPGYVTLTHTGESPSRNLDIRLEPESPTLDELKRGLAQRPVELPVELRCAGFDEARVVGVMQTSYVVVITCNRDGRLVLFRSDGTRSATLRTQRPLHATTLPSPLHADKLLLEEYSWGTGIQMRENVIYRFLDGEIIELWRGTVHLRSEQAWESLHQDGFLRMMFHDSGVRALRFAHGTRATPHGRYEEQWFEIDQDEVRPVAHPAPIP